MYLPIEQVRRLAEQAGLVADEEPSWVSAEDPRTLRSSYERVKVRALSTFEHLPEDEIEAGFAQFERDAAADPDRELPNYPAAVLTLRLPAWTQLRLRGPENVQGRWFPEDQAAGWARPGWIETEIRKAGEESIHSDLGFEAGEVHAEADVRSAGEGKVTPRVGSAYVVPVWVGEDRWITVRARQGHSDQVAAADLGAGE
jgi:hypothetical protein